MLWPLIWTISTRRFRWGVTSYGFDEKVEKFSSNTPSYLKVAELLPLKLYLFTLTYILFFVNTGRQCLGQGQIARLGHLVPTALLPAKVAAVVQTVGSNQVGVLGQTKMCASVRRWRLELIWRLKDFVWMKVKKVCYRKSYKNLDTWNSH